MTAGSGDITKTPGPFGTGKSERKSAAAPPASIKAPGPAAAAAPPRRSNLDFNEPLLASPDPGGR